MIPSNKTPWGLSSEGAHSETRVSRWRFILWELFGSRGLFGNIRYHKKEESTECNCFYSTSNFLIRIFYFSVVKYAKVDDYRILSSCYVDDLVSRNRMLCWSASHVVETGAYLIFFQDLNEFH